MSDTPNSRAAPTSRLAAFRCRDFRQFWLSLFIFNIGTPMRMTATKRIRVTVQFASDEL